MDRLKPYEVDAFAALVLHYMDMDLRHRLMHELPHVYNKLTGRKIVATVIACTSCERPSADCICNGGAAEDPIVIARPS